MPPDGDGLPARDNDGEIVDAAVVVDGNVFGEEQPRGTLDLDVSANEAKTRPGEFVFGIEPFPKVHRFVPRSRE